MAERNTSAPKSAFFRTSTNAFVEQPFVIVKKIYTKTAFCPLETPTQLSCKILTCNFKGLYYIFSETKKKMQQKVYLILEEGLCNYNSRFINSADSPFIHKLNEGWTKDILYLISICKYKLPGIRMGRESSIAENSNSENSS